MKQHALMLSLLLIPLLSAAQWRKMNTGSNKDLYDIHSSAGRLYVTGHNSAILRSDDSGKTWISLSPAQASNFRAVWFHSPDTGFVTGENARIQKTYNGGQSWTQKFVRTAAYAYDICFRGSDGLAVGKDMLAISSRNGGETWSVDSTYNSGKKLNSVCITPSGICWAAGDSGTLLKKHISSRTWTRAGSYTAVDLNHISSIGDSVIIACGGMPDTTTVGRYFNVFLRSTDGGQSWQQSTLSEMKTINSAFFFSPDSGFLCGGNGIISKVYQPFTQRGQQLSGTASTLNKVYFDGSRGYICGDGGVILSTSNMGGYGLSVSGSEKPDFGIYPNPCGGRFTISLPPYLCRIQIFDGMNRLCSDQYAENEISLETDNPGIYRVCVQANNGATWFHHLLIE